MRPVQDPLWGTFHDQNVSRRMVLCFMNGELGEREGEERENGEREGGEGYVFTDWLTSQNGQAS